MSHSVDVLIPAYNAEKTIRSAVDSIQRQTFGDILIHVVDDGSSDGTRVILDGLAASDARIRVHSKPNGGIVEALNFGLSFCDAEFLARHDADDLAYSERLETQIAYLRGHADVVAVGAAVRHIDASGAPTGTVARIGTPDDADPFHIPSREPYIIHPFLTARREAVQRAGGYRYVHHAEDTDLYWRLREEGRLYNLPDILGDYRLHNESISGGSIINGRIMALNSQLAALSARRRSGHVPDIVFEKDMLSAYKRAGSIEAMMAIASTGLDDVERTYLANATAAKLLELTAYRPHELDAGDCDFIGKIARRGFDHLPSVTRGVQNRHVSGAAARLAAKGQIRNAFRLVPPRLWPGFAARAAIRIGLPDRLRQLLRRKEAREALEK